MRDYRLKQNDNCDDSNTLLLTTISTITIIILDDHGRGCTPGILCDNNDNFGNDTNYTMDNSD